MSSMKSLQRKFQELSSHDPHRPLPPPPPRTTAQGVVQNPLPQVQVGSVDGSRGGAINPYHFGAIGDGRADDTAAFLRAVSALVDGGTLYIPCGTFAISSPITVPQNNISISGDGALIYAFPPHCPGGQNQVTYRPNENDSHRCETCHLYSLLILRGENQRVEKLRLMNPYFVEGAQAIWAVGSGIVIRACEVLDFGQGILIGGIGACQPATPVSHARILENHILRVRGLHGGSICYGDGIVSFGARHISITSNTISAAEDRVPRNGINCGPEGTHQQQDITISNNQLVGPWDYPITTEGCIRSVITSNSVNCACIAGIIERGENITVSNNSVHIQPRGSRSQADSTVGIQFFGVRGGTMVGNTISGVAKHAIMCVPSYEQHGALGSHITVHGNVIQGEFYYGIYLGNKVSKVIVEGNSIRIEHSDPNSMGIHGWYAMESTLCNNFLETPKGHAVVLSGCEGIAIKGNTLCDSRVGIYVNRESSRVSVVENSFQRVSTMLDFSPDVKELRHVGNAGLDA